MHLTPAEALQSLAATDKRFIELFKHGTLVLEIYQPLGEDLQAPHDRDEVYIIIAGESEFYFNGKKVQCKTGDFLFVPAGMEHRFVNFSGDFSTWVLFYGPVGGEKPEEAF